MKNKLNKQQRERQIENRRIEMGILETARYEGEKKKAREIAKSMKAKGFESALISEVSELSHEEIQKL